MASIMAVMLLLLLLLMEPSSASSAASSDVEAVLREQRRRLISYWTCTSVPGRAWSPRQELCVDLMYTAHQQSSVSSSNSSDQDTSTIQPLCTRPLIYETMSSGLTNQKLNLRDLVAAARAAGVGFLLTTFGFRQTAAWGSGVSWHRAPLHEIFQVDHFIKTASNYACVFYADGSTDIESVMAAHASSAVDHNNNDNNSNNDNNDNNDNPESEQVLDDFSWRWSKSYDEPETEALRCETVSVYGGFYTSPWWHLLGSEWRRRGVSMVQVLDGWSSFEPTTATEWAFFDTSFSMFKPIPAVIAGADAMIARLLEIAASGTDSNPSLESGAADDTSSSSSSYFALHPRLEKDWVSAFALPDKMLEDITRCGLKKGGVLFVAGGFGLLEDELKNQPVLYRLCVDGGFRCILKSHFSDIVQQLPPIFQAYDLAALVDFEILVNPRCEFFGGMAHSTYAVAAAMIRTNMGLKSAVMDPDFPAPCQSSQPSMLEHWWFTRFSVV